MGTETQEVPGSSFTEIVLSFTQIFSQLTKKLGFHHCSTTTFCILSQSRKIFQVFQVCLAVKTIAPVSKK